MLDGHIIDHRLLAEGNAGWTGERACSFAWIKPRPNCRHGTYDKRAAFHEQRAEGAAVGRQEDQRNGPLTKSRPRGRLVTAAVLLGGRSDQTAAVTLTVLR